MSNHESRGKPKLELLPMAWAVLWYALCFDTSCLPHGPSGGCLPAKTTQPSEDLHNPYGYSDMDWAAQLDPAYAAARAEVRRLSVGEDGTLSVQVKELIVLGVLASRGLQYGVEAHMRRALDYGATKDELFEAIKAAAVPGGGVAYS
jgi:AhpD family alkylhydroperoxidase